MWCLRQTRYEKVPQFGYDCPEIFEQHLKLKKSSPVLWRNLQLTQIVGYNHNKGLKQQNQGMKSEKRLRWGKKKENGKSRLLIIECFEYIDFLINNFQQQEFEMYFGFWNGTGFPSAWHYYVPFEDMNMANCATIPQTQTHIEQNREMRSFEGNSGADKRGVIDLSHDDLIDAGYETTKKLWSQQEDKMLLKLIDEDKIPWKQIQHHIPERTQKMCYSRYRRLLSQTKQPWTKEEDQKIKELVDQQGQNWKQFTINFKNRSSKQIKQRFINYLRPQIKRDHWTVQEDLKIIQCINKYGKKWKHIEKELGNRTDNQIKNRYYGRLKILYKNKTIKQRRKNTQKNKKNLHNLREINLLTNKQKIPVSQIQ